MDRIKSVGVARTSELPDIWLPGFSYVTRWIGYPRRPSVEIGDVLYYYASGKGVLFAAALVTSEPIEIAPGALPNYNARFPWITYVNVKRLIPDLRDGVPLQNLNAIRDLRQSIQRQSQIRLTDAEAALAQFYFGHI